jgi:hypothetical protein
VHRSQTITWQIRNPHSPDKATLPSHRHRRVQGKAPGVAVGPLQVLHIQHLPPPNTPWNDGPGTQAGHQAWRHPTMSHHPPQCTHALEGASGVGHQEGHQDGHHRGTAGQHPGQVVPQNGSHIKARINQAKKNCGHVSLEDCQLQTHPPWCTTIPGGPTRPSLTPGWASIINGTGMEKVKTPRQIRLKEKLLRWNLRVVYIPGKFLGGKDALSRYGVRDNNDETVN